MRKSLAAAVGLVFLFGLAQAASAGPWGNTGDRRLNSTLERLNVVAQADFDGFIERLSSRYGVSGPEIRQARETYRFGPADLFMATALASRTHRPVLSVAEQYSKNQGKGWGVMAKELGIKPGSRAFHEMKQDARGLEAHMKSATASKQKHAQEMQKERGQKVKKDPRREGNGRPR